MHRIQPHPKLDSHGNPEEGPAGGASVRVAAVRTHGSVLAELAVCRKAVGVGVRDDLTVVEMTGEPAALQSALLRTSGIVPPQPGGSAGSDALRWARVTDSWAVLTGPHAAVERWLRLARERGRAALDRLAVRRDGLALSVIGPRSAPLLASAGLHTEVSVGGVVCKWLASAPIAILGEAADRYLLIVRDAADLDSVRAALLKAGQEHAMSFVGSDSLAFLALAERTTLASPRGMEAL